MKLKKQKAKMKRKQIPTGKLSGFYTQKEDATTVFCLENNKKKMALSQCSS